MSSFDLLGYIRSLSSPCGLNHGSCVGSSRLGVVGVANSPFIKTSFYVKVPMAALLPPGHASGTSTCAYSLYLNVEHSGMTLSSRGGITVTISPGAGVVTLRHPPTTFHTVELPDARSKVPFLGMVGNRLM